MGRKATEERTEPSAARRRFLDAARREFAAKGYAGASIRSITGSLHMRESAFYAHFRSKQEAYDELFRQAGPAVISSLAAGINLAMPMEKELAKLAERAMEMWTSDEARASTSILLREAFGNDGQKRRQMLNGVSAALNTLQTKLKFWQTAGRIRRELDVRTLAFEFVAPLITTRLLFYGAASSAPERLRGRFMVEKHVSTFTRLIAVPKPASSTKTKSSIE